jgi:hypothetical protein
MLFAYYDVFIINNNKLSLDPGSNLTECYLSNP